MKGYNQGNLCLYYVLYVGLDSIYYNNPFESHDTTNKLIQKQLMTYFKYIQSYAAEVKKLKNKFAKNNTYLKII